MLTIIDTMVHLNNGKLNYMNVLVLDDLIFRLFLFFRNFLILYFIY